MQGTEGRRPTSRRCARTRWPSCARRLVSQRLTRHQHVPFRLGELIAYREASGSLARPRCRCAEERLSRRRKPASGRRGTGRA